MEFIMGLMWPQEEIKGHLRIVWWQLSQHQAELLEELDESTSCFNCKKEVEYFDVQKVKRMLCEAAMPK